MGDIPFWLLGAHGLILAEEDRPELIEAFLPHFKRVAAGKFCLLGGVNAQVTLIESTEEEIRAEVRRACRILGPGGGFILAPIDNIYEYTLKAHLEALIDEWRRVREY